MHVEYAFLADAAEAPTTGKLYVLGGGIDELIVPRLPAVHRRLSLVAKLRPDATECGAGQADSRVGRRRPRGLGLAVLGRVEACSPLMSGG